MLRCWKNSIGKSIARALGRKFVKNHSAVFVEAEIRIVVPMLCTPGRIIQGIKNVEQNPVFMLDEIDMGMISVAIHRRLLKR